MAKSTLKCYGCKQSFPRDEIINYTSFGAQTGHNYCKTCYEERISRDHFANEVCRIFGIKTPGPRMWAERKRLQEKLGYTDNLIVECLRYLYDVEKRKKFAESIYLVTPASIARMIEYKNAMKVEGNLVDDTVANNIVTKTVTLTEHKQNKKLLAEDVLLD